MRLRPKLPLLVGLAILAASRLSHAGGVDLTSYLAPRPAVGDFRNYAWSWEGQTPEERYDVVSAADVAKGWQVEWQYLHAYGEIVRPGVRIQRATRDDSPPPGCRFAVHYYLRACDLRIPLGRARRFGLGYLGGDDFLETYWFRIRGSYRAEGFEPLETPYASHPSALRVTAVVRTWRARVQFGDGFEVASRGPLRLDSVETRQSWYVEGVGIVGLRVTDGLPEQSAAQTPTYEMWLKDGLVHGQPYPPAD